MEKVVLEMEVKNGKVKKPSKFKKVLKTVGEVLAVVLMPIGMFILMMLPFIGLGKLVERKQRKDGVTWFDEESGTGFILDRYLNEEESLKYQSMKAAGYTSEEILKDVGIVRNMYKYDKKESEE